MRSTVGSRVDEDTFWKQTKVTTAFGLWDWGWIVCLAGSEAFTFVISLADGNLLEERSRHATGHSGLVANLSWAQLLPATFLPGHTCEELQGRCCLGNRRTKGFGEDWDRLQHPTSVKNFSEMFLAPFLSFFSNLYWHLFAGHNWCQFL